MIPNYTSIHQLPLMLSARDLAAALGISTPSAYNLLHSADFPTLTIGKRMMVPKEKLLEWINQRIDT